MFLNPIRPIFYGDKLMTVSKMGMALIEEFNKRQEEKRNTQHFYEVYKDVEIIDDMGDEPVKRLSTYKYSFYCDAYFAHLFFS